MRRGAITAILLATLGAATAGQAQAKQPFPPRVEILTRSQAAAVKGGRVTARVAFKGRGVVRLGGRIIAQDGA